MKTCRRCQVSKTVSDFPTDRNTCKECKNELERIRYKETGGEVRKAQVKRWYEDNREKKYAQTRAWYVQTVYGTTFEEYENMRTAAKVCAICDEPEPNNLDHNAETGKLRSFLCGKHNRALGLFNHDPKLLRIAADYLESFE
jgi:hypothetical protein